jgi:hypothetical protein
MRKKFQVGPQKPVERGRMGLKSMPMAAHKQNTTLQGPKNGKDQDSANQFR